jgi:folate-dependent phosphoribosylglycinamide formyltransferase PurN
MIWTALYSQTGSEIVKLSEAVNRIPDNIITDNDDSSKWHPSLRNVTVVPKKSRKDSAVLRELFGRSNDTLVTLHGWLNIVPEDICFEYIIYNGHPGLICLYPELKGKDPAERCWANIDKYNLVGSVVHRVIPEVDAGNIISTSYISSDKCISLEETITQLRTTSYNSWLKALNTLL